MFFFLSFQALSQEKLDIPRLVPSYTQNLLESSEGLKINCIQNIFQDHHGRLWMQTCGETQVQSLDIITYDGYGFSPIEFTSKEVKSDYFLTASGINQHNQLWGFYLGASSQDIGVFFIDINTLEAKKYTPWTSGRMSEDQEIVAMTLGQDSSYLIMTLDEGHITLHRFRDGVISPFVKVEDARIRYRRKGWLHTLIKDYAEATWFMGTSLPLARYDKRTKNLHTYQVEDFSVPPAPAVEIMGDRVSPMPGNLVKGPDGTLYFYYGLQFYRLDPKQDRFIAMEKEFPVTWKANGIFEDSKGNICFVFLDENQRYQAILQDRKGNRYDYSSFLGSHPSGTLTNVLGSDFLKEVYVCGNGYLFHMGVKIPHGITHLLKGRFIGAVNEMPAGSFLVNTVFNGWYEVSPDLTQVTKVSYPAGCEQFPFYMKPSSMVEQIYTDAQGRKWWTKEGDLLTYDPVGRHCRTFDLRRPNHWHPALFAFVGKDTVALTNWDKELFFYDLKQEDFISFGEGVPQHIMADVKDIHVREDGTLWVISKAGIDIIDLKKQRSTLIGHEAGFTDNHFLSIYEAPSGLIWLGTLLDGINLFDPVSGRVVKKITVKEGLADNSVFSILPDLDGDLWVATSNGISVVSPEGNILTNIYEEDGLGDNAFQRFDPFRAQDGRLFFGNENGLNVIDPILVKNTIRKAGTGQKVFLTDLAYYDSGTDSLIIRKNPPNEGISIILPARNRSLKVGFALSSYLEVEKNHFAYRLEGIEEEWHYVGPQHELSLTNLAPGKYRLQIKGADFRNNWTEEVAEVSIHAKEFFYKQIWFYLLCALPFLIFGLAWAYRIQKEKKVLEATVAARTREIRAQAEKLKELDQVKSRFFTNISHEFRTPLTVIRGMADQIQKEPEKWRNKGSILIRRNADNLLNLINQILDLRKLESGSLQLNYIHGDIIPYIRYIHESLTSFAENRGVSLHFASGEREIYMDYDEEKLLRILTNLLSNAIKFSSSGGEVTLRIARNGEQLAIEVEDKGSGIPEEKLPYIFDRFFQAGGSSSQTSEGSGVGLALTKELAEFMGGEIRAESTPGKGSCFTVLLPITHHATPGQLESPETYQVRLEIMTAGLEQEQGEQNNLQAKPAETDQLPTLLIVEDNADVRQYLQACLETHYQLSFAYDGAEGIAQAINQVPDLILSDVMMPHKDGFELCDTLKKDARTSHIPIVLLTAKADMDSRIQGWERGADAYLAKPFDQAELLAVLKKLWQLRQQLQVRYQGMNPPEPSEDPVLKIEDAFITRARACILENLDNPRYKVPDFCRDLGVSRTQLHNKLKALTGISANQFQRAIRMEKAKELLTQGDLQVAEVAFRVGFEDPSYFGRVFAEEVGMPPGAYQEKVHN